MTRNPTLCDPATVLTLERFFFRQRKKSPASSLRLGFVRPSIGQRLAGDRCGEAFEVAHMAGAVAVIELAAITMQMSFRDVVERPTMSR
jgi:hypothetical protein